MGPMWKISWLWIWICGCESIQADDSCGPKLYSMTKIFLLIARRSNFPFFQHFSASRSQKQATNIRKHLIYFVFKK